jgi:hypothetical protein
MLLGSAVPVTVTPLSYPYIGAETTGVGVGSGVGSGTTIVPE